MNNWRQGKIIIALGAMLVAGIVIGGVGGSYFTLTSIKKKIEKSLNFANWSAGTMDKLTTELKLDAGQRQQIQTVMDTTGTEFKAIFERSLREMGQVILRTQQRIDANLNPAQQARHAELKQKFRRNLKEKLHFDLPEETPPAIAK